MRILPGFGCPDKVLEVFSPMDRKGICEVGRGEVSRLQKKQNTKHNMEKLCEKKKQHHSSTMSLRRLLEEIL